MKICQHYSMISFHRKKVAFQKQVFKAYLYVFLILGFMLFCMNCSNKEQQVNKQADTLDNPEQFVETEILLETATANIFGTLNSSKLDEEVPLVIIIPGSGPTDRNGNNTSGLYTNTYKMISDTLAKHRIASLRYDKRGIAKSYYTGFSEEDLRFDDYVHDAVFWIRKMQQDGWFSDIFVLGHSEGSLIGMLAVQEKPVAGFISVAGTAQSADALLREQLMGQPMSIVNEAETIIATLKEGNKVSNVSQSLYPIFRPSVQPYLISWFKYDPVAEISRHTIPVLVIHGTTDLQIKSSEAKLLADANAKAELVIIENMNHILKDAGDDDQVNLATYSNPTLPLNAVFCKKLIEFLQGAKDN